MKGFYKKKRRFVTLIEMMIVMFLIALIIGVVGYNYQGSLEEGKVFKTKAGIEKLSTILTLRAAEDPAAMDNMSDRRKQYVIDSHLVPNPSSLFKDGWGSEYKVEVGQNGDGDSQIRITSAKFEAYKQKNPHKYADERARN